MTFIPNPAANKLAEAEVKASGALRDEAEQVAAIARSLAPVITGTYQASIHAEDTEEGAAVVASAPYSAFVEAGTAFMAAEHVLTRAAESAGLHIGAR